ncbi:ChaN family lipoprotein [Amaricoccus sp. W119]|uniref:ChaN family lipoprotein n=1 Tax=Amaricoccus sp. W119 TaxID=3391833 RepID=UPI0039A60860
MSTGFWRDSAGIRLSDREALDRFAAAKVVLLGESHDRAADHLWQADVIRAVNRAVSRAAIRVPGARGGVAVGLEMLPWTAQPALDAFVAGDLAFAGLLAEVRWAEVWGFDPALYQPIFNACRTERLPIFGLNVARPLVKLVRHEGWGALPAAERAWLSPAAPASSAYRAYLFAMTGGARPDRAAKSPGDPAFDSFVRAQQVWDRAFACRLKTARNRDPARLAIGIVGRGHLEYGHGVPAQLRDLGIGGVVVALPGARDVVPGEGPIADLVWEIG